MSFVFNELTVSGGNRGVEGTSGVINAITDVMTTAGWVIEDDRRSQPGSTSLATTHKIVLKSDGGESGTSPNYFFTMTSGTSSAPGQLTVGTQISTAYDVGSHVVPASGIKNPDSFTLSAMRTFATDYDGYNSLWIAADKDAVVFVSNTIGSIYWVVYAGKVSTFMSGDNEPYGIMLRCYASTNFTGSGAYGIVGNPPENITSSNDGDLLVYNLVATTEPRMGLGGEIPLFSALPFLWVIDDQSPVRKGVIGYLKHCYAGAHDDSGIPKIAKAVVDGTGQEFRVFGEATSSLFLRAS